MENRRREILVVHVLCIYQETQDELTSELLDLKEKYREVVDLLRDANEEIRKGRKRTYPGMGKQTGMFSAAAYQKGECSQCCGE